MENTPNNGPKATGYAQPSGAKKFGKALIGGTWDDIKVHAIYDVLIPGIKRMTMDAISILLFGSATNRATPQVPWGGWSNSWGQPTGIDYRSYYSTNTYGNFNAPKAAAPVSAYSQNFEYKEPSFATKEAAEEFQSIITTIMENQHYISCACFYDNCKMSGYPSMASAYGWTDMSAIVNSRIVTRQTPDGGLGYVVQMPNPKPLRTNQV